MDGLSISCIANLLGRHRSAISRQLSNKKNLDFLRVKGKVVRTYSAIKVQDNYSKNKSNCGAKYKLFQDSNLIKYIEDCVVNKNGLLKLLLVEQNLLVGILKYIYLQKVFTTTLIEIKLIYLLLTLDLGLEEENLKSNISNKTRKN